MPGSRRNKGLVIEIVGLPGAGKSTILSEFARNYGQKFGLEPVFSQYQRLRGPSLFWKLIDPIGFAARNPSIAMVTLKFWAESTGCSFGSFYMLLRCWALAARLEKKTQRSRHGVVVLDQGILQVIGSLSVPACSSNLPDVESAVKSLLKDRLDAVIWLNCPGELARSRLCDRSYGGGSRLEKPSWRESGANFERFESAIRAACAVTRSSGIPFLDIDARDTIEYNSLRIADWITDLTKRTHEGKAT